MVVGYAIYIVAYGCNCEEMEKGLDVTLDDLAGFANISKWMAVCNFVIYKWSELPLGPLIFQMK